jgi:anti-anti-sigma factor
MLIESTADALAGQHLCQVYRSERELRAAVSDFVRAGLASRELVILVSGSDAATVGASLEDEGIDSDAAFARRQICVITPDEDQSSGSGESESPLDGVVRRLLTALDERAALGYAVARMASEVDELYGVETLAEMMARERLGGELIATRPLLGLCLYDRRRHDTDFLLRAEAEHVARVVPSATVYRDEILAIGHPDGDGGLRLSGQVDLSNRSALRTALAHAARGGTDDIVVDLSETSFLDVGGLRLLVETAELHPERRVVLLSPATVIQQMLHLGGWGDVRNLVVTGGHTS